MRFNALTTIELLRRTTRFALPRRYYARLAVAADFLQGVRLLGFSGYRALRSAAERSSADLIQVIVPSLRHPFWIRSCTTDLEVFTHTVIRRAYVAVPPPEPVRFIIDAGANIGDTACFYASLYPAATIIAIEPDAENFQLLAQNASPYGSQIIPIRAALWSHVSTLRVVQSDLQSGIAVTETPNPANGAAETVPAVSLPDLLDDYHFPFCDILKCDIEGAETFLFSNDPDGWLRRTRSIYIELHGETARDTVLRATRRTCFRCRRHRDLYCFKRTLY